MMRMGVFPQAVYKTISLSSLCKLIFPEDVFEPGHMERIGLSVLTTSCLSVAVSAVSPGGDRRCGSFLGELALSRVR